MAIPCNMYLHDFGHSHMETPWVHELFGTAVVLFIVAIGNAINVEQLHMAPAGALTQTTALGLKSLALVSVVVYGSIAANLVVAAIIYDKPRI